MQINKNLSVFGFPERERFFLKLASFVDLVHACLLEHIDQLEDQHDHANTAEDGSQAAQQQRYEI